MAALRPLARFLAALVLAGAGATALYAVIAWLADAPFGAPEHLASVLAVQFFLCWPAYVLTKRIGCLREEVR